MNERDDGGPAFPLEDGVHRGMALRDHFAGLAMQGLIVAMKEPGQHLGQWDFNRGTNAAIGRAAFEIADAMLEARKGSAPADLPQNPYDRNPQPK